MFSFPLHAYHQRPQAKSNNTSPRKRKRKGSGAQEGQEPVQTQAADSYATSLSSRSASRRSATSAVLTPDEIHQYAIAGQPVQEELPKHPFPHGNSNSPDGPSRFDYDLRQQLKPAHIPPAEKYTPSVCGSLHQQHLAVMTTVLHRSLMEEDFVRAGRALGMILRDETGGLPTDIRAEGRWGIGAEILIRQDAQVQHTRRERSGSSSLDQSKNGEKKLKAWFTRRGFEDAKKYYERLIVQYPFYKQNPDGVSALDFYPAMFGLWIYVVHQEAKLKTLNSEPVADGSYEDDELRDETASSGIGTSSRHQSVLEELSQAKEIGDRMDSVMSSLPYRDHAELIDLRRMVKIWIHDLEEAFSKLAEDEDLAGSPEDARMEFLTSGITNVSLESQR
jgi:RNA polymerase I specific initiation factor